MTACDAVCAVYALGAALAVIILGRGWAWGRVSWYSWLLSVVFWPFVVGGALENARQKMLNEKGRNRA